MQRRGASGDGDASVVECISEVGNLPVGLLDDESTSYIWLLHWYTNHCACARTDSENGI